MERSIQRRIKRIQRYLSVPADGLIGPTTLTALENKLFQGAESTAGRNYSLTISRRGLNQLVRLEISSRAYYRKFLSHPVFPGGQSCVTIGIGYDLGYCSAAQIQRDWGKAIDQGDLEKLVVVAGVKGEAAKAIRAGVRRITIDLAAAEHVFYRVTIPRYAAMTLKAYRGCDTLFADAQAGLLSLVYNRGTRMSGGSRKEMRAIQSLVLEKDYQGIADQIIAMKRLWEGRHLAGLLKRRDEEARLVRLADRTYDDSELIKV